MGVRKMAKTRDKMDYILDSKLGVWVTEHNAILELKYNPFYTL
jgi:hypothetical protein